MIEKHRMGGDCLYTGCVPSKALIRSAHVAHLMRKGRDFGLQGVDPQVDFARVFSRIQSIIGKIEPNDSVERYTSLAWTACRQCVCRRPVSRACGVIVY